MVSQEIQSLDFVFRGGVTSAECSQSQLTLRSLSFVRVGGLNGVSFNTPAVDCFDLVGLARKIAAAAFRCGQLER
jgi:hypothetical protein